MKIFLVLIVFFHLSTVHAESNDLTVLNINGIGPDLLHQVKQAEQVAWWLEMGDTLIVSAKEQTTKWPQGVSVKTTLVDVDTDQLAFHVLGHCDHTNNDEILHKNLNAIYSGDSVRLINSANIRDKTQLFAHESIIPFEKNKVLAYQIRNRSFKVSQQEDSQVQDLLNQVDKNRWFSQVEYLASLDRMLEDDLIIAGEWLENKFKNLGLITSRLSLHSHYRGFNILGFKQGTSRADDWYVVGAHLDSRNATWNDNLPSPGAEDNASGCSGVLEIANIITQYETQASIIFMCFIEEESGLLGSYDVVTKLINDGDIDKVKSMFNMDMISYRAANKNSAIAGTNSGNSQYLANFVAAKGNLYTDIDWQVNLNMCCTDFVSFSRAGVPAVTSNEPDVWNYFGYHSVNDLPENLDPSLGAGIVKANLAALAQLAGIDYNSNHVNPDYTGMWYNPAESGHGLQLEVLTINNEPILYVTWFAHLNGEPIWLTGSGPLLNEQAKFDLIITDGKNFPASMNARKWGELTINFNDSHHANLSWQTDIEGFENGELAIEQLTMPTPPDQSGVFYQSNANLDACLTGSYYDPERNGEGIQITALGNPVDHISFNWYTYFGDRQFWFTGQGDINQDSVNSTGYYTRGVNFTPDFNSDNVETLGWGAVNIKKINRDELEVEFMPNENHSDFDQRTVHLIRNTTPFPDTCFLP